MSGALLLLAALTAVAVTGCLLAACVAGRSVVTFLLAAWVIGYGVIVGIAFVLSAFGWLGRSGFLVGLGVTLALALVVWNVRDRPGTPARRGFALLRTALSDPALAVLGALAAVAGVYTVIVAVATPQLDWDSVAYHMPRAALWLEQGRIGEIAGAADLRLSWNPPGAEIVLAFTMALARTDRYVALPQLAAVPLAVVAIVGIARRGGLPYRSALFGGLLFACLPVVVLQAPTAFNDLVVAALLLAAFCLVLGQTRADAALGALALSLALLTKVTAALALPLFVGLALVVMPRQWRRTVLASLAGVALGSAWYLAALAWTGSPHGGVADLWHQEPSRAPIEVLIRTERFVLDLFDLSGFAGDDRIWLVIAAAALVAVGLVAVGRRRVGRAGAIALLGAAAIVAALPWLVDWGRAAAVKAFGKGLVIAGREERLGDLASDPPTAASPFSSGFGVVFVLVWIAALVIAAVAIARRRRLPGAAALLLAPVLFAGLFAVATLYDGARGRFFVFPVGLAAAMFGLAFPVRAIRWAAVPATAAALLVAIVHAEPRPLGVDLLEPVRAPAVWGDDLHRGLDATAGIFGERATWTPLERALGRERTLAVATRWEFPLQPLFGRNHDRRLILVRDPRQVPADVQALLVTPHGRRPGCDEPWALTHTQEGWYSLYQRDSQPRCVDGESVAAAALDG